MQATRLLLKKAWIDFKGFIAVKKYFIGWQRLKIFNILALMLNLNDLIIWHLCIKLLDDTFSM